LFIGANTILFDDADYDAYGDDDDNDDDDAYDDDAAYIDVTCKYQYTI